MKFKSQIITQASGSVGGLVAARNRGGQYFRARAMSVNPNTFRQQAARAAMGAIVQSYSLDLSDAQREAWRQYGANVPITDRLGDSMQLSGQNQFIRSNAPRMQVSARTAGFETPTNLALIADAPTTFNTGQPVLDVSLAELDAAGETLNITGDLGGEADEGGTLLLYTGAPQNAGVRYFRGPYQLAGIGTISATDDSFDESWDTTDPEAWLADAVPVDGAKLPIRIRIAYDDGRLSQVFEQMVSVTQAAE